MRKKIIAVIAGLLLFVTAFIVVLALNINNEKAEQHYADRGQANLTEVYFECAGIKTNPLLGFAQKGDSIDSAGMLLPLDDETATICYADVSDIDKVTVYLESEDRTRLLDEKEVNLYKKGGISRSDYRLSVMTEAGEEYYLTVGIDTKSGKSGYYTTKVVILNEGDILKKQKMLDFANAFSDAALQKKTETIAPYVKYDESKSGKDLSFVNLQTSQNLVTWAGLEPKQGEKSLAIYEWKDSQISIALCYDVTSRYEEETNDYHVKECFTVRERDEKLFLLDYRRYTSQRYDGREDQLGNTSILLGVQDSDTLDAVYGSRKEDIFFTVDGAVWHFDAETNALTNIYGGEYKAAYGNEYPYELAIVNVTDGRLYFSSLGYVPYGTREGQNGYILYEYDPKECTLKEKVYIQLSGDLEQLKLTSAVIASLSDSKLFTVEVNGHLYSMDLTGSDVISLADGMDMRHAFINNSGDKAAWQADGDDKNIYLMDLDSGHISNINSNDRGIELFGFVRDDLVYGVKASESWSFLGFQIYELYDEIYIVGDDLEEKVNYKNKYGKLCNIGINTSNVTMTLCENDGNEWSISGTDTLNLASDMDDRRESLVMTASSEVKRNYYYISLPSALDRSKGSMRREAVCLASDNITLKPGSASLSFEYTAWEYGLKALCTDNVGDSINRIYDSFGAVRRADGSEVWNRDARELYLTMNLPKMKWTEEGYEDVFASMSTLQRAVDIFAYAGAMTGSIKQEAAQNEERQSAKTVFDELRMVFEDKLIVLGRLEIAQLLYYINLRHPVLALTADGEAYLLTGYTSTKLTYYNPADRSSTSITLDEAEEFFGELQAYYICYT